MTPRRSSQATVSSASLVRLIADDGSVAAEQDPGLDADTALLLYDQLVLAREFDRRMLLLQRQGRIGFYAPFFGQEATTIGATAALEPQDWVFPALREGAAALQRGLPLAAAISQLIGNALDRSKGRQLPCHYSYREGNYHAASTVIGTQVSHAAGAALAARLRGDDTVVLGFLGDGATSSNDFHCGMNFAVVQQSPCVLFCQNNHWASSVPISKQSASETIAQKGRAYGMPFVRVDGNDLLAVYAVTRAAVDRARAGLGPTFIEGVTYRRLGHTSSDDPTRYRDEKEVEAWAQKDPVDRFRRHLCWRELWSDEDEAALAADAATRVNEAIAEAETHAPPADATLITDVFAQVTPQLRQQFAEMLAARTAADGAGATRR